MLQSSRIVAKIACWSKDTMEKKSLESYLTWLRDQLKQQVGSLTLQ